MSLSRRAAITLSAGLPLSALLLATGSGPAQAQAQAQSGGNALAQAHTAAGSARAAYHLALESGKLPAMALDLAERIYARHRAAEEALGARLRRPNVGGPGPVGLERPEVRAAISSAYYPADMLRLLRDVEVQSLSVYLAQRTNDPESGPLLVALAADGAMHWTLLNHALGEPLPAQGLAAGGGLPMGAL